MKNSLWIVIILFCFGALPVVALGATADDPFSCNKSGLTTSGAGSTEPLRGPYVPVADYTVELNTGLLVYKECVLRELVDSKRIAALADMDKKVLTNFNTGNGGPGYPSRELGREEVDLSLNTEARYLLPSGAQHDVLDGFNKSIQSQVKSAIAKAYDNASDPRKSFVCDYSGDLNQAVTGVPTGNYWDAFDAVTDNPACNVFSAAVLGGDALDRQNAYELYKNRERLDWGSGIYDAAHFDQYGFRITDTPGAVVLAVGIQSVESGYKQEQAATDIGQLVDGLYVGMSDQVLAAGTDGSAGSTGTGGSDGTAGGLAGMILGGASSYLQTVAKNTGNTYVTDVANQVLQQLQNVLDTENKFNAKVSASIVIFTNTNRSLQDVEKKCFSDIATAVCQGSTSGSTCTAASGGGTLTIAKSTAFSQKVIDASTRAPSTALVNKLNDSNRIIPGINAIISDVRANPSHQSGAIAGLANIQPRPPHTASELQNETDDYTTYASLVAGVLSNTNTAWGVGAVDPTAAGWCNVQNTTTMNAWSACWGGNSSMCPTP